MWQFLLDIIFADIFDNLKTFVNLYYNKKFLLLEIFVLLKFASNFLSFGGSENGNDLKTFANRPNSQNYKHCRAKRAGLENPNLQTGWAGSGLKLSGPG